MVTYATSTPDVTVLHGDAYDLLPSLAPESIDLLVTSPPYWGLRTYEQEHNWHVLQDWLRTGAEKTDLPWLQVVPGQRRDPRIGALTRLVRGASD